ncbi:hypothetical protein ANN_02321 [Periplaneta americana]|uniref:Uncharacterized protein n=1 Tax=Periplaneta americana TaxID=6978 RepID=A0ABQ8TYF9_PERAM|nr:hypothetical protein ANN_02321 [Periplaneta americana]
MTKRRRSTRRHYYRDDAVRSHCSARTEPAPCSIPARSIACIQFVVSAVEEDLKKLEIIGWRFVSLEENRLKDIVRSTSQHPKIDEKNIVHTIQMVIPEMFSRVHEEMVRGLHLCIRRGGRHVENCQS